MTAALVGAASCARCGGQLGRPAALCPACGTLLLPAASGRMLGTSSPLLAGVVRASAARRRVGLALDVLPFAAAIVVGVLLAIRGAYADLALLALFTLGLLAATLALLLHRGRSVGRLLRVGLAWGRDPLKKAPAALLGTDLAGAPAREAALSGPSGPPEEPRPA